MKTYHDLIGRTSSHKVVKTEKLVDKLRSTKTCPSDANQRDIEYAISPLAVIRAKVVELTQEIMAPLVNDFRSKHLQDIAAPDTSFNVHVQKQSTEKLAISVVGLLLVWGARSYALLYIPGFLIIAYIYSIAVERSYRAFLQREKSYVDINTVITGAATFLSGYFVITAIACCINQITAWVTTRTEYRSRKGIINLFEDQPRSAWVVHESADESSVMKEVEMPIEQIQIGDQVVVMAGQMIPVDGTIRQGIASIDQHKLTGEGQPAEKTIGDGVFASTVVLSGRIIVEVEKTGQEMLTAQIGHTLNSTAEFNLSVKSRTEAFMDKGLPGLFALSAATLFFYGLDRALAVLWFLPGHRMFVVGPLTMLNYLYISSRQGILIKDGRSLEQLKDIDTIVFDKTGTLTVEQPTVHQILSCSDRSVSELLTYAAAAEYRQTHPIAKAILQAAEEDQLNVPSIDHTHYEVGYGITVRLQDQIIHVGSEQFMGMCHIPIPQEIQAQQARCHREGYSLIYIAIDNQLGGVIELVPTVRTEVKEVIQTLRESGKRLYIISGDHEAPTQRLAQELGIEHYFANTLPNEKAAIIQQLQDKGCTVCFVGDGINDAIALKRANVSISLRGATTIATDTAQIVLMDGTLSQLVDLFSLAKEFNHNLDRSFLLTVVPEVMGILCVFVLQWGLIPAVILRSLLWLPLLGNTIMPLYKHQINKFDHVPIENNHENS
ncbi:MAG: heavy metal translocating P-type ATPase [Chloroflexota bacterium]